MQKLVLLSAEESDLRINKIRESLSKTTTSGYGMLICTNANLFYIAGRVFSGYIYIGADTKPIYFVKRPIELTGERVVYIRKPEQIVDGLSALNIHIPDTLYLELDQLPYTTAERLKNIFPTAQCANGSSALRAARAVKTDAEIMAMTECGVKHERVYRRVPHIYQSGMTDIELQVEIERISRLEGCLGDFRICGETMEIYMGNILVGENADAPSPYDFAMGGAGLNPSLPIGADGSEIRPGNTVMVDMNGNFNGYMTDMTRVFTLGHIDPMAINAHACSIRIHKEIAKAGIPGVEAKTLNEIAVNIAKEEGLERYFMGHRQHAGFIGHGVGIEINEAPVIAPRSRDILQENNVIALEPKFVIPQTGAVGIENTYVVTPSGLRSITNAPEELISLE
jgi:Xaa-Pro aminopeptidase